jgi:hypothetical protein
MEAARSSQLVPERHQHHHFQRHDHTQYHQKPPSDHWTLYQIFYVFGLDGFGALILSGGINFAIAYGPDSLGYI